MYSKTPHNHNLPIYNKAVDIFKLSRRISDYLNYDLSRLKLDGKEHQHIYFSGDIVQQSELLGPEIIKAESETFSENKHKHAAKVKRLTSLLYKNCKRLETCDSNGKEYLPILRKELKLFSKLQRSWMLTL
jgi:hypothetical protein